MCVDVTVSSSSIATGTAAAMAASVAHIEQQQQILPMSPMLPHVGNFATLSIPASSTTISDFYDNDRLRFHTRCGSLVKLSPNCRSGERRRPLDEFNNGVVMTHRPLKDNELFEIRIDKLVDKWQVMAIDEV